MEDTLNKQIDEKIFYEKAKDYWSTQPATIDGVLGGLGHLSGPDAAQSCKVLTEFVSKTTGETPLQCNNTRALDCGAGIGRVSETVLLKFFRTVDLVDQDEAYIKRAKQRLKKSSKCLFGKPDCFYVEGLQNLQLHHQYDMIWCQWVLSHLTDGHLVQFFQRSTAALLPNGLIGVKENCTFSSVEGDFDDVDSSFTRTKGQFEEIFQRANLSVLLCERQKNFSRGLLPVFIWILKPS